MLESGGQTGVVDQQVDPLQPVERRMARRFVADVERERAAPAARRLDFAAQRVEPFGAAAGGRDVPPVGRKPQGRGASDARSRARDVCLFFHITRYVAAKIGKIVLLCMKFNREDRCRLNLEFFIARRTARTSPENRPGVMSRIAVVSVAVSVAVMLVALAVILGFKREVTARMVGFSAPVEVIDGAGIYAAESRPVAATARFEALLRTVDGVQRATPYAVKSGIVRTRDAMEGVALKGVDGSYDWSFFAGRLTEGRLPRVGDSLRTKELLLSARTARLLGVHAGDKVEMLFVAGDERPRRDRFKVSGLYSTGMEELERTALTDLRNVQRLSGWSSGEVSGYDLFLGDVRQADRLAEAVNDALLRSDLPETDGVVAVSVGERYPAVFDWLKAHDVNAAVVIAVMVAVAFFNMASALLILVLERTRMIGLLKAMGMENRRIRRIFLYRAAFIVGRGLLWGNLAAGLLCWFQARFHLLRLDPAGYMLSEVPVAVSAGWWLAVDVAAAGAILALLLVPAAFVARIRPDEAIKTD